MSIISLISLSLKLTVISLSVDGDFIVLHCNFAFSIVPSQISYNSHFPLFSENVSHLTLFLQVRFANNYSFDENEETEEEEAHRQNDDMVTLEKENFEGVIKNQNGALIT